MYFCNQIGSPCTLDTNVEVKSFFPVIILSKTSGGRGVTIHKAHGLVCTSALGSHFGMF